MASSKCPIKYADAPESIISLAKELEGVCFANRRFHQRSVSVEGSDADVFAKATAYSDGRDIDYDLARFLVGITNPTMVAIHYQGYGRELSTVIVELPKITCWAHCAFPRLDFTRPKNWNHCPNFWGSFILGIARVTGVEAGNVSLDQSSGYFIGIVRNHGVKTTLPSTIDARKLR